MLLIPSLIAMVLAVIISSRLRMNEIEIISNLSFAVVGSWIGGAISEYFVGNVSGLSCPPLSLLISTGGAIVGCLVFIVGWYRRRDRTEVNSRHH